LPPAPPGRCRWSCTGAQTGPRTRRWPTPAPPGRPAAPSPRPPGPGPPPRRPPPPAAAPSPDCPASPPG
ncbi:DUF6487 domain-containing protein, partial [Dysosmobacter welbionis]